MMKTNYKIPDRLKGLEIGDVLIVRDYADIVQEFGPYHSNIRCGFTQYMKKFCGVLEFTVDKVIMDSINNGCESIVEIEGYSFSLDMVRYKYLKTVETKPEKIEDPTPRIKVSIKTDDYDSKIIDKMISMVDLPRFVKLLSIAGSDSGNKKMADKQIAKQYLEQWAYAKYEYFLLFGEKLALEKDVSFEMDEQEMASNIEELKHRYNKYLLILDLIDNQAYIDNSINYLRKIAKYVPYYQTGMKVSKFLSSYLQDKEFDIELSKVMQNRVVKGKIFISIDPYDYLTMSINQHDWRSCHSIENGDYAGGCISYMTDETTLICHRGNNKEYNYNVNGFKFEGSSKSWRQCLYFDKKTCSMIFGRQYPSGNEDIAKETRYLIEKQISEFLNIEDKWTIEVSNTEYYSDKSNFHYSDVTSGYSSKFVRHKYLINIEDIKISVGTKTIMCVHCGKEMTGSDEHVSCCLYNDGSEDEDGEEESDDRPGFTLRPAPRDAVTVSFN